MNGVSFDLQRGSAVGIVGESGCGKSTVALALMQLLTRSAEISGGSVSLSGRELLSLNANEMRHVRGRDIALVFQDPMTALNPVLTIGQHLRETLSLHEGLSGKAAHARSVELLKLVGIAAPESRLAAYPHQLSGGMRQRVMIALAVSGKPKLLIADEPTTALDVTIQAQILQLLSRLRDELDMSIILVSHDLGVVANLADRVLVMYGGAVVEDGTAEQVLLEPKHPYTKALIAARPEIDSDRGTALCAIPGAAGRLTEQPSSCSFEPRCAVRMEVCSARLPKLAWDGAHGAACWHVAGASGEGQVP
ncbi:ABC transporter ATP-binding protein [Nitratireductor pacificus]|uniref:Oligopeptide ABC transporter ATP-binding protein n=1 Tax=Nitratireductor pacificus pht-3B TaxID=391937 RepID=K2M8W4_9HYPH|nr:ABC transporter ATP-binding protein [Nitratireductor pacificus]EKF18571.1 oligopeptide ABC transporter ATP-binding protein [Nitratireductor pacificus pht-3B]